MFLFGPGSLKDIVPFVEQITRAPGRALIRNAFIINGVLLALSVLLGLRGFNAAVLIVAVFALAGLISTAFFSWRRDRLQKGVDAWHRFANATIDGEANATHSTRKAPASSEIIVINEDGTYQSTQAPNAHEERLREAHMESLERRDTWFPGIEAAQRAAITAAGGVANAPFLRDDLRWTILAGITTFASVPLNAFFTFWVLLALL